MMSFDTWFYNLKRGEFMPDSRTSEEERKLIVAVPMQPAIPGRVESGNDAGA
jgi:hypothetical protein